MARSADKSISPVDSENKISTLPPRHGYLEQAPVAFGDISLTMVPVARNTVGQGPVTADLANAVANYSPGRPWTSVEYGKPDSLSEQAFVTAVDACGQV
ncbi:hypothetical protein Pth03_73970 [Planotetraspora thailandica]|uniref:Uncharacterized protein n=1 Tax=Planotetraspora thailandica TaxID=487172 RepID=A0A8J4DE97_9ACTN|nr:hypothetical protein Pth03_73970 [Planotetraspora thailandica]